MIRNILFGLLFLLVSFLGGLYVGLHKNVVQWEMVVESMYSVAESSYVVGCLEQRKIALGTINGNTCRILALIYKEGLRQSLENINNGKSN